MANRLPSLIWTAKEYAHSERSADWFWMIGIIAIAIAVTATIFNNLLFGIFILLAAATLMLYAIRHPHDVRYELSERGVMVNRTLFPFHTLDVFWIHEHTLPGKLHIRSRKQFMPYISIPLEGVRTDEVREFLLIFLREEEIQEPVVERFLEVLGF